MKTLVYIINTDYPNNKAHSIQITKTIYSLLKYFNIIFIVNRIACPLQELSLKIENNYGLNIGAISFVEIKKKKLRGIYFYITLFKIIKNLPENSLFYTRSYSLCKRLVRSKFIHKKKVYLESHKKDGFYKEEKIPESFYQDIRTKFEQNNESRHLLQHLYEKCDGVLFTSKTSKNITKKYTKKSIDIWYPLNIKREINSSASIKFVYCGSLKENKLILLLLRAIQISKVNVDIIGGEHEDVNMITELSYKMDINKNIKMLGKFPYNRLSSILPKYKFGIATMEGIKVIDYLENGLIPIIPKISTYTDYINDDCAVYFKADCHASLAKSMLQAKDKEIDIYEYNKLRTRYSLDNFGEKLYNFLK